MSKRLVDPALSCSLRLVFLIFLIWQLSVPAHAQAQPQRGLEAKNILILHSHEANAPVFEGTDRGLSRALQSGGIPTLNQFFESLDLRRYPVPKHRKLLVEQMRLRYSHRKLDMIVTMYPEALEFVLQDCRNIFPDIPFLALYLPQGFKFPKTDRTIIGHSSSYDINGTFETALKLVPGAKRVYVVSGAHEIDRSREDQARLALKKWEGRLEFRYLSGMSFEDILATLSSAPPDTIILLLTYSQDVAGRHYTARELTERLSQVSTAPIFGIISVALGHGIAGGYLINFEHIGAKVGEFVLDILRGTRTIENIPGFLDVPPLPMFDWRQLRHWNLNEEALPKGSIVINKEFTLWDFRYYVIGALIFCVAETGLIIFLFVQRRRKKVAEDSRRKAEGKYRNIFEGSVEGIFETSPQGQPLTANPALARILGYDSPDEFISVVQDSAHQVFADPDKRAEFVGLLEKKDVVLGFECELLRRDGEKICASINSWRVCGPDGKTLYYSGFMEDITDRKRVEETLRQRNQYIETVLEQAPIGFAIHTIDDGVARFVSARFEEIYGVRRGTLDSHYTFFDKVWPNHPDLREEIRHRVVADMASGDARRMCWDNVPVPLRSGETRYITAMNIPVLDQNLMVSTVQDVTEQVRAENALRESELRFRQVAENVGDFIWEVDANGLYRYTSPSVEKILGYRPDELVGKMHFYDLCAPEVREEFKAAFFTAFAAKQSFRAFPNPNLSKEGKVVHLETSGVPVLDADGNLAGYRGADTDVTERKKAEEELRKKQEHLEELVEELRKFQEHLEDLVRERTEKLVKAMGQAEAANRAKSAFLANMSHELRAPLNSILGIAQLMERDQEFPAKQRELLEILSRSGQQLFELVDDVLEMSRIEAGKTAIVSKTFDLHRFLDDLEEMMSPRAEKKGLALIFERDSALPKYIQTDGRKLRQILINLLGNAIKFTEKGRVTLRTNFKEGMDKVPENEPAFPVRLEFEVEDTGIGFAQEDREKIFDPFVQLNPAQKPSGGIGLGLAICHKFAALLGGEITVRSQVGKGTTFKLDIGVQPAERSDIPVQEVRRQVMGLASGQSDYRLLVVDDNLESRLLLRRLLEPVGFRVLEAASGQEAIDLYQKDQPHLIWLDIRMPGMDGYAAARRIREAERERRKEDGQEIHTPIIALTAGVMEDTGSPSHSEVFDDWVYKPFRETEVFDKIEKHLGVQFVSQPSVSSAVKADNSRDKAALSPADLSVLPADWLKEFFQTMEKGRSAQLLNLIDQIRPEHADLARALAEMVRIHQYEKLIPLTREALKGDANG